ncbi:NifQ nitrogen fixation protein, molybdenum ion binding [Cupriavidus taiwanensis]|uniref:NifQ nitrogen fixation protein, molybdenum ion binding n=2 Tax=Cupriavidus taiwanensis TaxID=164546 RepID=A0A375JBI0_9BURK|nr:NifQ nitrogen fixation protein, molybdenum ion binding [Cupriavidus taiwanensis]
MTKMNFHSTLMRHAVDDDDCTVLTLAGAISSTLEEGNVHGLPIIGLDANETRWLLAHWFPGAEYALSLQLNREANAPDQMYYDEVEELVALLEAHADPSAGTPIEVRCVSHALACGCLKDKHLWQNLRLPSRAELLEVLRYWFPMLAEKNVHGMKWKKFLYKQLCERDALYVCRAPSCSVCPNFGDCFGPE